MSEPTRTGWSIHPIRSDLAASGVGALATLPQAVAYGLILLRNLSWQLSNRLRLANAMISELER